MANPTIGFITCPFTNEKKCSVRRDKKQKLYYYGLAGLVKPNLPAGQEFMQKHTEFIGDNGSPLSPVATVNEKTTEEKPHENSVNENQPVNEGKSLIDFFFKD